MEASITYGKASEFSCVSVWISTALNSCCNQAKLEEFLVEKACVATEISYQVTNLRSDIGIRVLNERFQVVVNVSIMNRLVEIFTNPCKLRYKGQRVKDQWRLVLSVKKLVLRNSRQTTALYKLLREVFRTFRSKYQT